MKKLVLIFTILMANSLHAQLSVGDMAFIAFNADADDDFALVNFVDIPANTIVYFTDSEWDGSAFGTDENDFSWNSGASVISEGTVITFNTISASASVSVGTIVGSPGGISGSAEAIFAFLGTAPRAPTIFITAVANSDAAYGSLDNTGLTAGTTAITYPTGTDVAQYIGPRTGLQANGYLIALNDIANYTLANNSGDQSTSVLPFDTTAFIMSTVDATAPSVANAFVSNQNTIDVVFTEDVTLASAENTSNYAIDNGITITSVVYNSLNLTATVMHSGFTIGTANTITISNMEDYSANIQNPAYTSNVLFYNATSTGLIITEIMYNTASDNDGLEFLEIYNSSTTEIALGGIQVKDENSFVFTFPQLILAAGDVVLLATDKTTADAFYGVTFIDLVDGTSNSLGNGGEVLQILNALNTVIFEMEYSDDSPWPTEADGDGPSLELQNPNGDFNDGTNWAPAINLVGQDAGVDVLASPGNFIPNTTNVPEISFAETAYSIAEDGTSVEITIDISSPSTSPMAVDVTLVTELLTATQDIDFVFMNQTITIPANSVDSIVLNIPITNDTEVETDEVFLLELSNPSNATLGNETITGIYISDTDSQVAVATNDLSITYVTSYLVDASGAAEISAHDPESQQLFVLNSSSQSLEILDFSDLSNITTISTIDVSALGTDGPTSVATKNGFVVVAISNGPNADGVVAFMDIDGNNVTTVTVGNLPDMVAFTPDGTKILVANEGQPNDDYSIDPEGSISVIDISNGFGNITQANVINLNFNAFDADIENLRAQDIRIFGPNATVSQDVEPEFITFSSDSQTAWVSLQENNAIAVINLITNTITDILPLGLKDHSLPGNTLDTSDETDFIFFGNWPVKGMYMPDAIASYDVGGITYLVTANEGDAREYDTYEEEVKISDSDITLDPTIFPNQSHLALEANLGELTITNATGDTDGDGDLDEIHVFGSRSFSIWNTATGDLVYDSGDDFERITAADPIYGELFNASNSNNNFKNRSDNKGPEPEGVTIAEIDGQFYAFITLERVGGFMTYNITNPSNPVFENYANNRDLGNNEGGDLAPEGIIYISPENSPSETALIVLSNEVSSTISVYSLDNVTLSTQDFELSTNSLKVFPNPVLSNQTLFFNKKIDLSLFDLQGRELLSATQVSSLKLTSLNTGTYIIKTSAGVTKKIIIE